MFNEIETWLRGLQADAITKKNENEYKKNIEKNILMSIFIDKTVQMDQDQKEFVHPYHKDRLEQYKKNIVAFKKSKAKKDSVTIAFGDSLLDIPRTEYTSIPEKLNFAISGSWHYNMKKMAEDLNSSLEGVSIKNVVIGSLGGNPFLSGQGLTPTINYSIDTLNTIRKLFPVIRIIVFGLPPVYNKNATVNSIEFERSIYTWVINDVNSVFLPLQKKFAGFLGLFPKVEKSSDGVHFSPKGVFIFDQLVEKAKTVLPKSIVD